MVSSQRSERRGVVWVFSRLGQVKGSPIGFGSMVVGDLLHDIGDGVRTLDVVCLLKSPVSPGKKDLYSVKGSKHDPKISFCTLFLIVL